MFVPGQRWVRPGQGEPDSEWRREAACLGMGDRKFIPTDDANDGRFRYGPGKVFCSRCPVRVQCLRTALVSGYVHGMWGGIPPIDRGRLLPRLLGLSRLAAGRWRADTGYVARPVQVAAILAIGYLTDGVRTAYLPADPPVRAPRDHTEGPGRVARTTSAQERVPHVPVPRWVTLIEPERPVSLTSLIEFGPFDPDRVAELDTYAGRQPALVASGQRSG